MVSYGEVFKGLNKNQRRAVEAIDGPVLVIAGPGTGKTQLLTTRIAHILQTTDTLPQNILCLTFTESAAQTMRERLSGLIGQAAYDITISTYHAFGSELIRAWPDYFAEFSDMQAADDLMMDRIFREILATLPYNNPLKFADLYLGDIKTFVSDAKRALLTPEDLTNIAEHNNAFLQKANGAVAETLQTLVRIDKKSVPIFKALHKKLAETAEVTDPVSGVVPLSTLMLQSLRESLEHAQTTNKTTELTKWKNTWLAKNQEGVFVIDGERTNQKLLAAAGIYQQYITELSARGLYDYDDMILRAVRAMEQNNDFRYTLQEQYQYMLLDEFQDTNGAQLRLVELLTDNPVNEGRPNVLAVGDDDQAIYAFQGANYSHMLRFQQMYRDVLIVPLTENYRSHSDILHLAKNVAEQIDERLHHHFAGIEKTLTAENKQLSQATVERREAKSDAAQFAWTARHIKKLLASGVPASEIAVLAPQHKHLEPLLPFLRQEGIPVRYEKRENVLDDPAVTQLLRMSELILTLAMGQHQKANSLWAEVLSFEFWELPTSLIWQLSWQASDDAETWSEVLLQNETLKPLSLFFIRLSMLMHTETLETILDYLIGIVPLELQEPGYTNYRSPFYAYHFGDALDGQGTATTADFWNLLTNLVVLRARLRDYRQVDGAPLRLQDFIDFVEAHRAADIKILNTSPYQEADEAVQLMTAYKSKGQEFESVFLLATNDEVWGSKARNQGTRLSIPPNLQFIRYAGATNDERLRLFYVAVTRAKTKLYLVNYTANFAGKAMTRLKYLNETPTEQGDVVSPFLPAGRQHVQEAEDGSVQLTTELKAYWQLRHEIAFTQQELHALLKNRIERFQLSPTHVASFIDLEKQGPSYFFMNTILRFPRAPTPTGEFGNAIHETLEWIHHYNKREAQLPSTPLVVKQFTHRLQRKSLSDQDYTLFLERGTAALRVYMTQRTHTILPVNESEWNFRGENVFIGPAHMSGKIDKLIVNKAEKTLTIVDYKTGKSYTRWVHDSKLHRYRLQLYLYKTLVEKSRTWQGYKVVDAYLEFVEPDEAGMIHELHLTLNDDEQRHAEQLAGAIWDNVQKLHIPDTSTYTADIKGMEAFEKSISENIFL